MNPLSNKNIIAKNIKSQKDWSSKDQSILKELTNIICSINGDMIILTLLMNNTNKNVVNILNKFYSLSISASEKQMVDSLTKHGQLVNPISQYTKALLYNCVWDSLNHSTEQYFITYPCSDLNKTWQCQYGINES